MRKQLLLIIMALMPMIGYANITTNIDGMIYSLDTYEKTAELVKGGSYSGYVKIPSTVVYGGNTYDVVGIGSEVFKNCTELTSVSIPSSIKNIRSSAFSNCVNLTAVYITDIESWCKIMFSSSSSSNPLVFAHHLFLNGEEIINLVIPDGVEIVEAYSFTGCDLKSVSIPASVTNIGSSAFSNCTKLTTVSIPNSVEYINGKAFAGCSALPSINIPEGVESVGKEVFKECIGLTSVTIGDDVTSIGSSAFEGCSNITKLKFGRSLTRINSNAFKGCASIPSIDLPSGVSEIGSGAFDGCSSVTQLTIPSGVSKITSLSFANCISLKKVYCYIEGVPSTADDAFKNSNQENATLYVSKTSLNEYKMISPWSKFGSIFELTDEEQDIPEAKRTIHVAQAGTLSDYMNEEEKYQIEELTLTGEINGTDFKTIRRMLGAPTELPSNYSEYSDGWGDENMKLRSLDISGVRIVAGGTYLENHEDAACDLHLNESDIIPARVFDGCKNLVSIAIPDNVNFIGSFALRGTAWYDAQPDGLVYLGKVLYAYKGNGIPSNITIEDGILGIAGNAFADMPIESVTIPASVTRIGDGEISHGGDLTDGFKPSGKGAFQGCKGLKSISIPNNVTHIGSLAFANCISLTSIDIPNSVTTIGESAFSGCSNLSSVTIPNSVTTIGGWAFSGCSGLASITIPNSVTSMGWGAFSGCSGLTSVTIPNSVTSIGEYAFSGCDLQEVISMIENPFYIYTHPFSDNTFNNATLYVPAGTIDKYKATEGWNKFMFIEEGTGNQGSNENNNNGTCGENLTWTYDEDTKVLTISGTGEMDNYNSWSSYSPWYEFRNSIQTIIIESGVTSIGSSAFKECIELNSVDIPNSVTSIGSSAFSGCRGLTSLVINDNISRIEQNTFYGCSNLATLIIGKNVTFIADGNFVFCGGIKDIYCYAEDVPYASKAFEGVEVDGSPDGITLHVPANSIKDYQANYPWSNFKTIVAIDNEVSISISASGKTTLTSSEALDFCGFEDLKAYVATGYESNGTIWLTRIKQVPAGTPILIKGEASQTYNVPVMDKCVAHFENMFMGSSDEDLSIGTTTEDGKYKNFYMSGGQFKPASASQTIKAGKCYLQVPASFKAAAAGEDQTVKIADSGKSSYAPPVDVDLTNVEGLKAYAATGYDPANSTIWLTRINKIQAGEGVLLKGEAGKEYTLPSAAAQAYYGNMFVGNIGSKITINETSDDGEWSNFYLASGSFKKVSGTREIGTNKSYLQLPTSLLVSSARGRKNAIADEWFMEELETETLLLGSIGGEDADGTTRIDAIADDNAQPNVYYNLQGQRVENPGKGLYIKNGKKIVIR